MNGDSPGPSEVFYSGAVARIGRLVLWLTLPWTVAAFLWLGWRGAVGAAGGALAGYESFLSLARAVNGLADRVTTGQSRESGTRIVVRFVARYLLIGVAAYVIFTVSRITLYGFVAGLCLPALAMMCEAGYELTMALRRGL